MKKIRKGAAVLLCMVMVLLTMSFAVFAEDSESDTSYPGYAYISLSDDGRFVVSDGVPLARLEVPLQEIADVDLADWGLERYSFTDYTSGEADPDCPTALKLYLYLLDHYYHGDPDTAIVCSGEPHQFFMVKFWGHDCNLLYYVNGTYPLFEEGWGATADGIVLDDGDFVDIALYTNWGFYNDPLAGFNYFAESGTDPSAGRITFDYEVGVDEPFAAQVIRGMGNIDVGADTSFTAASDMTVYCGDSLYSDDAWVVGTTDENGGVQMEFDEPGTYYLWFDGTEGEITDGIVNCPNMAVVTVAVPNTAPALAEGIESEVSVTVRHGDSYSLDLSSVFTDADGDDLSYGVSVDGSDFAPADADYVFTPPEEGVYELIFFANDGQADSEDVYFVTITAEGHVWGEPVVVEPTVGADGSRTYTCTVCGAKKTETYPYSELLAETKEAASEELENYKDSADYREAEQEALTAAVAEGKEAIEAAETVEAVAEALEAAEAAIDAIKTEEQFYQEIEEVVAAISGLPSVDEVKVSDEADVKAARDAYEALNDSQKAEIPEGSLNILAALEEKIEELKADIHVTKITMDKTMTILGKETKQLIPVITPSNAGNQAVTWKSSNEAAATVDAEGNVTGVFRGKTSITATTVDGKKKATCAVNVEFGDINEEPAWKTAINWGADKKITGGYKETNLFGVKDDCTRSQAMVFLWRLAGSPPPNSTKYPFKDVPENATYKKAIIWAVEKKITSGYTTGEKAGTFGVDEPCTRGQIMVFLWRYFGKPAPKKGSNISFTDMPTNATYKNAITWGASYGITGGYKNDDGTKRFEPDTVCWRGHIIFFLYKADKLK